jgi:hypothetical protein
MSRYHHIKYLRYYLQVRELKFDFTAEQRVWDKTRAIRKYVAFDIPSILSHLYASLKKNNHLRKPQLSRQDDG